MRFISSLADIAVESPILEPTVTATGEAPAQGSGLPVYIIIGVVALVAVAALLIVRARRK